MFVAARAALISPGGKVRASLPTEVTFLSENLACPETDPDFEISRGHRLDAKFFGNYSRRCNFPDSTLSRRSVAGPEVAVPIKGKPVGPRHQSRDK